jgi:3-oxoacyl-[acyl-carrier protein] reductase
MELNLKGVRALVAGSSKGLGYAVARMLLQEGARVMVNGRNEGQLRAAVTELKSISKDVAGVHGDVTDREIPARLVGSTVAAFGGLDILVTNSGGPPVGAFESFDDAAWDAAVGLSFLAHVRLIRAALPHLRSSATPSILAITSFTIRQPLPNLVLSNSIRAATAGLAKSLSLELAPDNIRVNAILPGWTRTDRIDELMRSRAARNGTTIEAEIEAQVQAIPLRRMADPEEFARAACFLVSPAASYITGGLLLVDGGVVSCLP